MPPPTQNRSHLPLLSPGRFPVASPLSSCVYQAPANKVQNRCHTRGSRYQHRRQYPCQYPYDYRHYLRLELLIEGRGDRPSTITPAV